VICHAVHGKADQLYMADELGVDLSTVQGIDIGKLEHLERGPDHKVSRGVTVKKPANLRKSI